MQINYVSRDTRGVQQNGPLGAPGPFLLAADTLLGSDVYNGMGENLGSIKECMIEMATGQVAYVVLSFGGFLGLGDRLFAVPWTCLKLDTVHRRLVLNVAREALKQAPGFDKDHWPSTADPAWEQGVSKFYGARHSGPGH